MAIRADRSNLPKGDTREGVVPDADSHVVRAVLEGLSAHIAAERSALYGTDDGSRPMSRESAVFRHSDAAGCARQLGYKIAGVEPTNPPSDTDLVNMWWGTVIHEQIDRALAKLGDGWGCEVPCGHDEPVRTAGTADAVFRAAQVTVVETKTVGGFAYKLAVGERGEAKGPAWSAIVQGALNAAALDADELVILDVAKELISKGLAERKGIPEEQRGLAAWHYTPEQFRPIAEAELRRVERIVNLVEKGTPVPAAIDDPEVPKSARIVDPMTGRWEVRREGRWVDDAGKYWACADYCAYRDHCAERMRAEQS